MVRHPLDNLQLTGYFPGVIGKITELHAVYYFENWGFDVTFETQVGRELSEFVSAFHENRDGLWACRIDRAFAGSLAVDGHLAESDGARLRWFIVAPAFHGRGIGSLLLSQAIRFCTAAGHPRVFLWTFKGLDAARTLYERHGFKLSREHEVHQWGQAIIEQKFELYLPKTARR